MFQRRSCPAPTTTEPGSASPKSRSNCRRQRSRISISPRRKAASRASKAAIMDKTPATFSVPARRPSSCWPPNSNGCTRPWAGHFKSPRLEARQIYARTRSQIALAQPLRRKLADPLRRVAEKGNILFPAEREDLRPRLEDAGFVVRGHDGHARRPLPAQTVSHPIEVHSSGTARRYQPKLFREIAFAGSRTEGCSMAEIQTSSADSRLAAQ